MENNISYQASKFQWPRLSGSNIMAGGGIESILPTPLDPNALKKPRPYRVKGEMPKLAIFKVFAIFLVKLRKVVMEDVFKEDKITESLCFIYHKFCSEKKILTLLLLVSMKKTQHFECEKLHTLEFTSKKTPFLIA